VVHGSFDVSKNRWFPVFHPQKTASKNRQFCVLKKNQNQRTSQSGYLKTAESKNRQL
jgi:hypothetical protein